MALASNPAEKSAVMLGIPTHMKTPRIHVQQAYFMHRFLDQDATREFWSRFLTPHIGIATRTNSSGTIPFSRQSRNSPPLLSNSTDLPGQQIHPTTSHHFAFPLKQHYEPSHWVRSTPLRNALKTSHHPPASPSTKLKSQPSPPDLLNPQNQAMQDSPP
jgi:hypothetical protein